jgi:hypothetical protein
MILFYWIVFMVVMINGNLASENCELQVDPLKNGDDNVVNVTAVCHKSSLLEVKAKIYSTSGFVYDIIIPIVDNSAFVSMISVQKICVNVNSKETCYTKKTSHFDLRLDDEDNLLMFATKYYLIVGFMHVCIYFLNKFTKGQGTIIGSIALSFTSLAAIIDMARKIIKFKNFSSTVPSIATFMPLVKELPIASVCQYNNEWTTWDIVSAVLLSMFAISAAIIGRFYMDYKGYKARKAKATTPCYYSNLCTSDVVHEEASNNGFNLIISSGVSNYQADVLAYRIANDNKRDITEEFLMRNLSEDERESDIIIRTLWARVRIIKGKHLSIKINAPI